MATAATTAPKKVNATTESILGAAAVKLAQTTSAIKGLVTTATDALSELESKSTDLSVAIVAKTDELALLDVAYSEKRRSQQVTLKLEEQADIAAVAQKYATENGKLLIDQQVYDATQESYEDLKANFTTKVREEAQAAIGAATSNHKQEIALQAAGFKATQAETAAKVSQVEYERDALKAENQRLYKQIEDERAASIARAQASAISGLTINGGGR